MEIIFFPLYIIFKNRGVKSASGLLRTKVKYKNNQLLKLSNVLSFGNNFNLDVLINFVLIKIKNVVIFS